MTLKFLTLILTRRATVKKLFVLVLLLSVSLTLTSCSVTKQPKEIQEITHWTGDKESVKNYLNSPYAQADRYLIEALR